MAFISYNNLWKSTFNNIVSGKDKVQDIIFSQLKLEVQDAYNKDEKIATNFKTVKDSDVINKAQLDENLLGVVGHLSFSEKDYNDFTLHYNKQSVEKILIQRAVKTTIQKLYYKGLFDFFSMLIGFQRTLCLLQ